MSGHLGIYRVCACANVCVCSSSLVDNFAVFNNWHCGLPGPTLVNRQFADSCTSHGTGDYTDLQVLLGFPQRTIFQVRRFHNPPIATVIARLQAALIGSQSSQVCVLG